MAKKILLVLLVCMIFCFACSVTVYGEGLDKIEICIKEDGSELFCQEFIINPEFSALIGEKKVDALNLLSYGYSAEALVRYLLGDKSKDIFQFFDDIDDVKIEDCIDFVDGKFFYHEERSAHVVNREKFLSTLLSGIDKDRVEWQTEYIPRTPLFSREDLEDCTEKISEFRTEYKYSLESRKHNVELASRYLTCAVIKPKEIFSFNKRVGKRTVERGFEGAKVIVGGKFTDGVGGGVCQVATTLYNASIRAGLNVLECNRHTLAPSYVPLSFDSMVSEWSDLRLENTKNTPIFIKSYCMDGVLVVEIYGEKLTERYEFESVVTEVVRHEKWEEGKLNYRNGYKSEGYKLTYEGNTLISRTRFRQDTYSPYEIEEN